MRGITRRSSVQFTMVSISLIVIGLVLTGQSLAEIDPKSVVGLWLFDEGKGNVLKDSSGNGNDGELIDGPEWVDGKFGKALKFDDGPDHVIIPDSPSLSPTSQISIVAWIYPIGGYQGSIGLIVYKDNWPGKARSYDLSTGGKSGNIRMHISHDGGGVNRGHRTSTSNEIKLGEWNHAAGTFDGKKIEVYINAVKQENTTLWVAKGGSEEGPIADTDTAVGIGRAIDKGDGYDFSGIIDEVAIFDVALTAEDINSIMAPGLGSTIAAVSPSGKVALTWGSVKAGY